MPTLSALLDSPHRIVGVVTQPDRPRGRGQKVSDAPVKALAIERGLVTLQPERLSREVFAEDFKALDAELGVVAAYGKLLPEWLLQMPAFGKKGRMTAHIQVLAEPDGAQQVIEACFNETSTLGLRSQIIERHVLPRRQETIEVGGRRVRVKLAQRPGSHTAKAESDDLLAVGGGRAAREETRREAESEGLKKNG